MGLQLVKIVSLYKLDATWHLLKQKIKKPK